ncbi:hypothetical protein ACLKA6_000419 [Drosophila palustris]
MSAWGPCLWDLGQLVVVLDVPFGLPWLPCSVFLNSQRLWSCARIRSDGSLHCQKNDPFDRNDSTPSLWQGILHWMIYVLFHHNAHMSLLSLHQIDVLN